MPSALILIDVQEGLDDPRLGAQREFAVIKTMGEVLAPLARQRYSNFTTKQEAT